MIFEDLHENIFEISIAISVERRGKGLGKIIVKKATEFAISKFEMKKMIAKVFSANKASLEIFESNSYEIGNRSNEPWELMYIA